MGGWKGEVRGVEGRVDRNEGWGMLDGWRGSWFRLERKREREGEGEREKRERG